jgi:nicotinamide mononucleotide (NMN) deamidase PncC
MWDFIFINNIFKMFEIDQKILTRIGKLLLTKKQTISVAESVTSGLLQFASLRWK